MIDCSGSMSQGDKLRSVGAAVREAIPLMKSEAEACPDVQLFVRVLAFSTGARWQSAEPVPITDFAWSDLTAQGETQTGLALRTVAEQLAATPFVPGAPPPVLVLISDGEPTDDFAAGLSALLGSPWGESAVRVAIGIGKNPGLPALERFISRPATRPMEVRNPEDLRRCVR